MTNHKPIDIALMRQRFYYEPELGQLFYRHNNRCGLRKGDRAGSNHGDGHRRLEVNGEQFYEHRVIYAMVTGRDPGLNEIDHFNQVKGDNNFYNLELVTRDQHRKRNPRRKDNKTGVTGVHLNKSKKSPYRVTVGGNYYGCFSTLEEATTVAEGVYSNSDYHAIHGK